MYSYSLISGNKDRHIAYDIIKRVIELVLGIVVSPFVFSLSLLFMLISLCQTGTSPLYIQKRGITLEHKMFNIYKIRTMKPAKAEAAFSSEILMKNEFESRISLFGSWLRRTGLDELPQLLNIFWGNMSITGPRPLSIDDLEKMKRDFPLYYRRRQAIKSKPGISGYWQVLGDREKGIKNLLEMEEQYELSRCFSLDLYLIIKTISFIFSAEHSDAILKRKN